MSAVAVLDLPTVHSPAGTAAQVWKPTSRVAPSSARPKKQLGDPTPLACTVAKTALEVVLGATTVDTLNRWVTADIRAALAQQSSLARRAGKRGVTARIQRVRVCRLSNEVAEVSIVANDGTRTRAVAARFEALHGRWHTTVLEIG